MNEKRWKWLKRNHHLVQAGAWGVFLPVCALTSLKESILVVIVISIITEIDTKLGEHHALKGRLENGKS